MNEKDVIRFMNAIRTKITLEVPAAIIVHAVQTLAEKQRLLNDNIAIISQSGGNTLEIELARDANEVVACELLAVLADKFGRDFIDLVLDNKEKKPNNSKKKTTNKHLH